MGTIIQEERRSGNPLVCLACCIVTSCSTSPSPIHPLAAAHLASATRLYEQDKLNYAEAETLVALEYNPNLAEAFNTLGLIAQRRGQIDHALELFRSALVLREDFAEAHNNLGAILLRRHALDDAIEAFDASLAIDPGFANARYNRSIALVEMGDVSAAVVELEKLIAVAPKTARFHAELWLSFGRLESEI